MTYEAQYAAYREMTEQGLEARLNAGAMDSALLAAMRYAVIGGGKRVRAVLCLSSCVACGGAAEAALSAACALEMLHAYSLIHDDLPCMDDDDMRRGKPSCHKQFGEATALLAGDALLTLAFGTLCEATDAATGLAWVRALSDAAGYTGMIRGQELDLAAEERAVSLAELEEIHLHKTGALIRAAAAMGGTAARADEQTRATLDLFAREIGLVFQIVDDMLDRTSDTATLGKPVGSDAAQHKSTYPGLIGMDGARRAAEERTQRALDALDARFGPEKGRFLHALAENLLTRIN